MYPPNIDTVADLDEALKDGAWAWPGGYPRYFITTDGGALDFDTVKEEYATIKEAIESPDYPDDDQWRVIGVQINYEDPDLYDDHTGHRIQSAYAEDDATVPFGKMTAKEWSDHRSGTFPEEEPEERTEGERMRDFFFGPKKGSFWSLPSWRRGNGLSGELIRFPVERRKHDRIEEAVEQVRTLVTTRQLQVPLIGETYFRLMFDYALDAPHPGDQPINYFIRDIGITGRDPRYARAVLALLTDRVKRVLGPRDVAVFFITENLPVGPFGIEEMPPYRSRGSNVVFRKKIGPYDRVGP